jgi:hypothetical protein
MLNTTSHIHNYKHTRLTNNKTDYKSVKASILRYFIKYPVLGFFEGVPKMSLFCIVLVKFNLRQTKYNYNKFLISRTNNNNCKKGEKMQKNTIFKPPTDPLPKPPKKGLFSYIWRFP